MNASLAAAGRVLLTRAIDYAGLFPPAGLDMAAAVDHYRRYMAGEDRWALGRFVCPVERLEELGRALLPEDGRAEPWKLAAVARAEPRADLETITVFNLKAAGQARVDSLEARTPNRQAVEERLRTCEGLPLHCEVDPSAAGWEAALDAVRAGGARAKLRTGGLTRAAIPPAERVAAFLHACHRRELSFKATAGLHHAFCGTYALTYAAGSEQAPMHGFVNLTLAAACLGTGGSAQEAEHILRTARREDFEAAGVELLQAGRRLFTGFGSCSFEEPLQWLHQVS